MRLFISAMLLFVLSASVVSAQAPPPPPGAGAPAGEPAPKIGGAKAEDEEADDATSGSGSSDGIVPLPGDTVFFKNGSKLEGITVVRESPAGVEVQVTSTDSLMIPRKQIDRIEYQKTPEVSDQPPAAEPSILKGQKVSAALYTALTSPLPAEFIDLTDADLVETLGKVAEKAGVTIEVADSVKKIAPRERKLTAKLPDDATLTNFLEDSVLGNFPNLAMEFPEDKIVVSVATGGGAPAAN